MDVPSTSLFFFLFFFFFSSFVIQPFSGEHHPQTDFNLIGDTFVLEIKTVARRHRTVATPSPPLPSKKNLREIWRLLYGEKKRDREVSPNFGISVAFLAIFLAPQNCGFRIPASEAIAPLTLSQDLVQETRLWRSRTRRSVDVVVVVVVVDCLRAQ
jgi:hypothetical protein